MAADVLSAHARLAAIDADASSDGLLKEILDAAVTGAGAAKGVALVPGSSEIVCTGFEPDPQALAVLSAAASTPSRRARVFPASVFEPLFGSGPGVDPRAIPLSAGDEVLAFLILPAPPADPVAFASVTAHAASLLSRVRMTERVREADFELKYRVWELESLYDVGLSIAGTLDLDSLADDVLLKSVSLLNARKGTLIVRDATGDGRVLVKEFGGLLFQGGLEGALDLPEEAFMERGGGDGAFDGDEKLLAVSIVSDGQRLGVLIVADKENRAGGVDDWSESDKRILSLFANQAAIALENARLHREAVEKEKMEREIELAASIQKTILPESLPAVPGLELAGGNRPTRQVGGDYFDVFPLADGRTAFCVADVSGKGVPAALLVSTVHACLHLLVTDGAANLSSLVERTNRHLSTFSSTRKFVTLFMAVFHPASRQLSFVNAGHNPGIVLSGGDARLLPAAGLPIGMFPEARYSVQQETLAKDDLLLLYSDGITEAHDALDEEYGMERLTDLLKDGSSLPTAEICGRIFDAVAEFTRGVAQYDDQTVLVARVG